MKKFYDQWWKDGAIGVSNDFKWKWPNIKRTLPKKNSTILDFGCGDGRYIQAISDVGTYKMIGADISEYALKKAKKRFPDVTFYRISGDEKIPVKSNSVDYVIAGDVIEHIFDARIFLTQMNRILKNGGKIFISTPYHGLIKHIVIALIGFDIVYEPTTPHIRFFTKKSLIKMVESHGFRVLEYNQYGRIRPLSHGMFVIAEKIK